MNLLSFKDIRLNGYHVKTRYDGGIEYLYIIKHNLDKTCIMENLPVISLGLYYNCTSTIEARAIIN